MQYYTNIHLNLNPSQSTPTVGTLLRLHLEQSPASKVRERKNVFFWFCNAFVHQKITQLTPVNLKRWLLQVKMENNYSNRNLEAIKSLLNHFFKFVVAEGFLSSNPLDHVVFERCPPTRSRVILNESEIIAMLEAFKKESPSILHPYILVLANTGARKDEIRKLKWSQVDFGTGFIYLDFTKNGDRRALKMNENVIQALKAIPKVSEFVFLNQFGRLISATQIDDGIIRLQKHHPQMKRWRCHDLRHSYAYNFLKQGGNMYQLQAILGHRSIQMTIDLYGQLQAVDVEGVNLYCETIG